MIINEICLLLIVGGILGFSIGYPIGSIVQRQWDKFINNK
jgi:hypothetical protein